MVTLGCQSSSLRRITRIFSCLIEVVVCITIIFIVSEIASADVIFTRGYSNSGESLQKKIKSNRVIDYSDAIMLIIKYLMWHADLQIKKGLD